MKLHCECLKNGVSRGVLKFYALEVHVKRASFARTGPHGPLLHEVASRLPGIAPREPAVTWNHPCNLPVGVGAPKTSSQRCVLLSSSNNASHSGALFAFGLERYAKLLFVSLALLIRSFQDLISCRKSIVEAFDAQLRTLQTPYLPTAARPKSTPDQDASTRCHYSSDFRGPQIPDSQWQILHGHYHNRGHGRT